MKLFTGWPTVVRRYQCRRSSRSFLARDARVQVLDALRSPRSLMNPTRQNFARNFFHETLPGVRSSGRLFIVVVWRRFRVANERQRGSARNAGPVATSPGR